MEIQKKYIRSSRFTERMGSLLFGGEIAESGTDQRRFMMKRPSKSQMFGSTDKKLQIWLNQIDPIGGSIKSSRWLAS